MTNVPRWLEVTMEIDYRLWMLKQIGIEDARLTTLDRMIDKATGHDKARLAEAKEIIEEVRALRTELDSLVSALAPTTTQEGNG